MIDNPILRIFAEPNLAIYTQNFGIKFRKMSVPFAPPPEILYLVEWKAPMDQLRYYVVVHAREH